MSTYRTSVSVEAHAGPSVATSGKEGKPSHAHLEARPLRIDSAMQ